MPNRCSDCGESMLQNVDLCHHCLHTPPHWMIRNPYQPPELWNFKEEFEMQSHPTVRWILAAVVVVLCIFPRNVPLAALGLVLGFLVATSTRTHRFVKEGEAVRVERIVYVGLVPVSRVEITPTEAGDVVVLPSTAETGDRQYSVKWCGGVWAVFSRRGSANRFAKQVAAHFGVGVETAKRAK